MGKKESTLEYRIVETALRMFNDKGIEYVGMRELAAELGIRIGNLTYYFPTKDDLVNRISLELARENSDTMVPVEQISMAIFFDVIEQVFRNHLKYRCLMLSFVHIVQRNASIAKRYRKTQSERKSTLLHNIRSLIKLKEIQANKAEIDFLVSAISLIARFWISESVVSYGSESETEQGNRYIRMIARIFFPYATAKGRRCLKIIPANE